MRSIQRVRCTLTTLSVSKDYPGGIKVDQAALRNPKNITLNALKAEYLASNFTANGSVDNAIGYALRMAYRGHIELHADKINLNDLMGTTAAARQI